MAKKTKKQKQRAATRRVVSAPPASVGLRPQPLAAPAEAPAEDLAVAEPAAASVATAPDQPAPGGRRRIERLNQAAAARPQARLQRGTTTAAMFRPLETEDAAIPFDRVPYVPADLRRVAIMAACMVVLIIIAAIIVSHIIT